MRLAPVLHEAGGRRVRDVPAEQGVSGSWDHSPVSLDVRD